MRALSKRGWLAVALVALIVPIALAGTTGKITGVVTDQATGQPIPGAAISVQGTVLGALTDDEGRYVILNVPVGTYTVRASMVGFRSMELTNVSVSVDLTTYESYELEEQAVEMQPITVTSERPLVIQDQTSSLRLVTGDEVANLPSRSYQEVVSLQAGVVRFADNQDVRVRGGNRENSNTATMNIRGGRRSEVAYFVDGFSQQDPVTGLSTTQVNQNAIQEIAVTTGGFNAEYGWISSGAINVTTKEGSADFHGGLDLVTDNVVSDAYDYNAYSFHLSGPLWKESETGSFFLSGERRWQGDRSPRATTGDMFDALGSPDRNRLPVNSLSGYSWQGKVTVNLNKNIKWRSGILGSFDDWREYTHAYLFNKDHSPRYEDRNNSLFTQIVHTVSPNTFYTFSANYFTTERERGDGVIFDDILGYSRPVSNPQFFTGDLFWEYDDMYAWRLDSSYVPDESDIDSMWVVDTVRVNPGDSGAVFIHTPVTDTLIRAIIDSTTSPDLIAYSDVPDFGLATFEAHDTLWNDAGEVVRVDTTWGRGYTAVKGGDEGHVWEDYLHRKSSYVGLEFDLTSQVHPNHEIGFGLDFQRHTLRYYQSYFPVDAHLYFNVDSVLNTETGAYDIVVTNNGFKDVNHFGYDLFGEESDTLSKGTEARHPITFAAYLQDKFEWEGLVVNAGVRFDYFNANTDRLKDPSAPLRFYPDLPADRLEDSSLYIGKLDEGDFEDSEAELRLSPRVGIGFPISDRAGFHLSFGKFFQRPDLTNLYMSRDYLTRMLEETPYYNLLANPNLEPEQTTAYEVGFQQQLGDYTRLEITAFHKDTENLTVAFTQNAIVKESPTSFGTFRNADWGTVRGLELGLKMRRNHNIQMDLSYTLQYAKGTGSWPETQYNIVWQNMSSPRHSSPLEFDQRHKFSANVDVRTSSNEGPKLGDFYPLENAGVNFVLIANSGTPYTPVIIWQEVSSAAGAPDPKAGINSVYSPWTYRLDFKANRTFYAGKIQWDLYLWVMNLFDRKNAIDVYESTGRPNTTGWLQSDEGIAFAEGNKEPTERSGLSGRDLWLLKEGNPLNYDTPRQIRFGLRVNF